MLKYRDGVTKNSTSLYEILTPSQYSDSSIVTPSGVGGKPPNTIEGSKNKKSTNNILEISDRPDSKVKT